NILDLPDKILIMIFDNLGLQDRGNARVCKKFCEIEEKSEESQSKTMDQLVIKVTQGLIRFDGSNMPKACVGEKYTYECAILLMKRLARIFTIDSISFEVILVKQFIDASFFQHKNTLSKNNDCLQTCPTPLTIINYEFLRSILAKNNRLSAIMICVRMTIDSEELKELRTAAMNRGATVMLEDISDAAVKEFAQSVMDISPD
ncbi:hypothetical protein PFISCL1PPCAC_3902, partial [Pristionchus fissidentatus]